MRFLVTVIILLPFVPRPKISFKELYLVSMTFGVLFVGFIYYSMYLGVNPSLATVIMQLAAPFSVIIARIVLKEDFSFYTVVGICLAFVGVTIVVSNPTHFNGNYLALVIILLASFFNAVFNIQSRRLKDVSAISLYCWTNLIALPHLLLISYFLEGDPIPLLEKTTSIFWGSLFYNVLASLFGITLWIYLLQKNPVYQVMPYNLLVPVFGISLSVLLLHENITWHLLVGGLVTVIGVYISQAKHKAELVDVGKKV